MPVGPNGGVYVPVGIRLVPLKMKGGGPWTEEWLAMITIGTTFALDMSPAESLASWAPERAVPAGT